MVCDEDEWQPKQPRNWIDRFADLTFRGGLVCAAVGAVVIVGLVAWAAMWLLMSVARAAEPDDVLLIVNGQGTTIMRCELPTDYLPGARAIICIEPPVYRDGFEP